MVSLAVLKCLKFCQQKAEVRSAEGGSQVQSSQDVDILTIGAHGQVEPGRGVDVPENRVMSGLALRRTPPAGV